MTRSLFAAALIAIGIQAAEFGMNFGSHHGSGMSRFGSTHGRGRAGSSRRGVKSSAAFYDGPSGYGGHSSYGYGGHGHSQSHDMGSPHKLDHIVDDGHSYGHGGHFGNHGNWGYGHADHHTHDEHEHEEPETHEPVEHEHDHHNSWNHKSFSPFDVHALFDKVNDYADRLDTLEMNKATLLENIFLTSVDGDSIDLSGS